MAEIAIERRADTACIRLLARRGQAGALASALFLPSAPAGVAETHDAIALAIAPGEWLIVRTDASEEEQDGGFARAWSERAAGLGYASDQSSGRALIALSGAKARRVLAQLCAIDWRAPAPCVVSTGLARVPTTILERDEATFDLWVPSTYAGFVIHELSTAAREFGFVEG